MKPLVNHVYCCKLGILLPTYDNIATTIKNDESLLLDSGTYMAVLESYKTAIPPNCGESAIYKVKLKILTGNHKGKIIYSVLSRPTFLNKSVMKHIYELE